MGGRASTLNKLVVGVNKSGSGYLNTQKAEKQLKTIFNSMDTDGSGYLERGELEEDKVYDDFCLAFDLGAIDLDAKKKSDRTLTRQRFLQLVKQSDSVETDDKLDFEEFKLLVGAISAELDSYVQPDHATRVANALSLF